MKRYRILRFHIDTTRNLLKIGLPENSAMDIARKEMGDSLKSQYGEINFDIKFKRYMELEKPTLSVVEEHSGLLDDISNSYVCGNLYSALTGSCCLGERIFNNIIFKVMEDFKNSPWYKKIHSKNRRNGSIVNWDDAIEILSDWKITDLPLRQKYLRLKYLRDQSVHYQRKDQDLAQMSLESINIINYLISRLFGLGPDRKDILLYFDVPGELFIKKEAMKDPMVKAFYIPCSTLVGPEYEMVHDPLFFFRAKDTKVYENVEIEDSEFVRLRNEFTNKGVVK